MTRNLDPPSLSPAHAYGPPNPPPPPPPRCSSACDHGTVHPHTIGREWPTPTAGPPGRPVEPVDPWPTGEDGPRAQAVLASLFAPGCAPTADDHAELYAAIAEDVGEEIGRRVDDRVAEAIAPLTRDRAGKLGIYSRELTAEETDAPQVHVDFGLAVHDAEAFRELLETGKPAIEKILRQGRATRLPDPPAPPPAPAPDTYHPPHPIDGLAWLAGKIYELGRWPQELPGTADLRAKLDLARRGYRSGNYYARELNRHARRRRTMKRLDHLGFWLWTLAGGPTGLLVGELLVWALDLDPVLLELFLCL